jgi:NADH dehydrogenase [ubiquinone] 1 alpha subcomplex assembly factor 7
MIGEPTPLELDLIRMVEATGPIPFDRYMALCLGHPRYGYYMSRDPFGASGDFTTAPEVTQMFGEIIGIWCMQCFELMGKPQKFDLIELGPGRGTLMADLLRAACAMPEFVKSLRLRLIETSPVLRDMQKQALANAGTSATWHDSLDEVEPAATLLIANEFFDALPVLLFQRLKDGWAEFAVGLREGKLAIGLIPALHPLPAWTAGAKEGEVAEVRPAADSLGMAIGRRLAENSGAALIIDYGHGRSSLGQTLQAVRRHRPVSILDRPGESDLTAHVDFDCLVRAITTGGGRTLRLMPQGDFLHQMGLAVRAQILSRNATEAQKSDIAAAMDRVAGPKQMGQMFQILAATSPWLPCPHPFSV